VAVLTVGPTSTFPTIASALLVAAPGDTIVLEPGYGNETAAVTVDNLFFDGTVSSSNIALQLAPGIGSLSLQGFVPAAITDNAGNNVIIGNAADNAITVSAGIDSVNGGAGNDRLIVEYSGNASGTVGTSLIAGSVDGYQGAYTSVLGSIVTFNNIDSFDIRTGTGNDIITTAGRDDSITVNGGIDVVEGAGGIDRLIVNYSTMTGNLLSGPITTGTLDGYLGTYTGDLGDIVTFDNIENFTIITGSGNDTIVTAGGEDVLNGGSGADTMSGLAGGDLYFIDNTGDVVAENPSEGIDTEVASVSRTLDANVENLVLAAGMGPIEGMGNQLDNTITGNESDNVLAGGGGFDTVNGGGGNDTLLLSGARANYTITRLAGTGFQVADNRAGSPDGLVKITNVESVQFSDQTTPINAIDLDNNRFVTDFNPDRSDIPWQRLDGTLMDFQMKGPILASYAFAGSVGSEWLITGVADYNGDHNTDLLFRRDDGSLLMQILVDNQVQTSAMVGQVGSEWQILGSSDFNGDTRDDILWQHNTNGTLMIFDMNGPEVTAAPIVGQIGSEWDLQGTGDYNGDATGDMLWRRADGSLLMFEINNNQVQKAAQVGQVGNEWQVAGSGDFNGDHKTDILWQRDDGVLMIFNMDGAHLQSAFIAGQVGREWDLEGVADYNHDGTADLLWRHDEDIMLFEMAGNQVDHANLIGRVGTEWDLL
jgi:Ca2+-binding RTX toxin-like protein